MTALHTRPIPRPTTTTHEHAWLVESRHPTSEGTVLYVRCADCGTRRVDLQTHPQTPPAAVSATIGASVRR
ncbi:hypothetical protein [Streptomyces sp. AC495_CC817]|uniref:hypothetical protein n=1 Tax=Streptomyces sp. AC495_CC817 TaxID=2823900 RepID=UPI001C25D027|nr:hypothetical protein [Streptomyces sp. AC495_CC817]